MINPLTRGLCLAPMLRIHHLAQFQKPGGTNPRVVNERDPDHPDSWVDVTRFLGQQLSRHHLNACSTIGGDCEGDIVAWDPDP